MIKKVKKLKPCPFCGKSISLKSVSGDYGYTSDSISIRCSDCNIGFEEDTEDWEQGRGHFSVEKEAYKKLISRWNSRV